MNHRDSKGAAGTAQRNVGITAGAAAPGARRGVRSWFAALTAAVAVTVLAGGCGTDEGAGNDSSLVVGVRAVSVNHAVMYWAAAKGYFKNAGVDVTFGVGEAAVTARLVSGQTDIYSAGQGDLLGIANSGKAVKTIYGTANGVSAWVVASSESVRTPADCKTLTTATPGTVFYAWAKQLEQVYRADWKLTQLTTVPAISANVVAGRTDCANGNITYYQKVIEEGRLRVVLDPQDESSLPPGWPKLGVEDVMGGLPQTLEAKKPAVEKFLKAYDAALRDFMPADPKDIAQTLISYDSDWAAVGSRDVLAKAVEQYKPLLSPDKGYISKEVWSTTLSFFAKGGLDFLAHDPGRFGYENLVDMSYYEAAIGR